MHELDGRARDIPRGVAGSEPQTGDTLAPEQSTRNHRGRQECFLGPTFGMSQARHVNDGRAIKSPRSATDPQTQRTVITIQLGAVALRTGGVTLTVCRNDDPELV